MLYNTAYSYFTKFCFSLNVQRHKEHLCYLCLWNVLKFNFIEETKKLKMAIYAHFTLQEPPVQCTQTQNEKENKNHFGSCVQVKKKILKILPYNRYNKYLYITYMQKCSNVCIFFFSTYLLINHLYSTLYVEPRGQMIQE